VARRGKFGRLPRTAPDLTGAVVALIREAAAQNERNIIDAWKEGGKVDGKKVTDAALLEHFDDKLEGLSPDDPSYVEAKNTRQQYGFAVKNSKMELSYAQKKTGDRGMAAFYKNEASKHPKNSEVWRELMKASASYQDRANQASGGGGGGRRRGGGGMSIEERNYRITTPRKEERAWMGYQSVLLELARDRGILLQAKNPDAASATTGPESFADMQAWGGDFTAIQKLINEFATSPDFKDYRDYLTKWIQTNGQADFNGDFSMSGTAQMRADRMAGINRRMDIHRKLGGTATQLKNLHKEGADVTTDGGVLGVIDPMQRYEEGRKRFNAIIESDDSTPLEIHNAIENWKKELGGVYEDLEAQAVAFRDPSRPSGSLDDGWTSVKVGKVRGELDGLYGDTSLARDTLFEESSGHASSLSASEVAAGRSDQQFLADIVSTNNGFIEMLADPYANAVIAKVDDNGQPSMAPDADWGAVNATKLAASGNPIAYSMVSGEKGGVLPGMAVMQATYGQPITVTQTGGLDRMNQPTTMLEPGEGMGTGLIGAVFKRPDGSQFYGLQTAEGMRYTNTAPWAPGTTATTNPDGSVTVALPPAAVAGTTTFDPQAAVDDRYIDPTLFKSMPNTMLLSTVEANIQYDTYNAPEHRTNPWVMMSPTELQRMVAAESGGDPAKAAILTERFAQNVANARSNTAAQGGWLAARQDMYRNAGDRPAAAGGITYVSDAEMRRRALEFINRPGMQLNVGGPGDFGAGVYSMKAIPGSTFGRTFSSDREVAEEQIASTPASRLAELVRNLTGQWMDSAAGAATFGQRTGGKPASEQFTPATGPSVSPIAHAATYGVTPKPARNRAGEDAAEAAFYRGSGKKPPSTSNTWTPPPALQQYMDMPVTQKPSTSTGGRYGVAPIDKPDKPPPKPPPQQKYVAPKEPDLPGLMKGNVPHVHL
jgi:hypothetical protein